MCYWLPGKAGQGSSSDLISSSVAVVLGREIHGGAFSQIIFPWEPRWGSRSAFQVCVKFSQVSDPKAWLSGSTKCMTSVFGSVGGEEAPEFLSV